MKRKLVVLTGAGISAESGLSTFRGAGGLWEGHKIEDVATPQAWQRNPELVLEFYNQRRAQLPRVQPNEAHRWLQRLEEWLEVYIITQNVDDLHERAGSRNILHLHGELTKVRSERNEDLVLDWGYKPLKLGDMGPDGAQLRPHVVWFGEAVPAMTEAERLTAQADIFLIVGTSLQVYPAAGLVYAAPAKAELWYIDPHPTSILGNRHVNVIQAGASEGLKIFVSKIIPDIN
jgi:NAD-dependent deacetylase